MVDDIPLDKIVEPHRKEIVLDACSQNNGSPVNDCLNVGTRNSVSPSPETDKASVDEVKIDNSKPFEIKEESDDITNSLFGKCGKCQKPKPGKRLGTRPLTRYIQESWTRTFARLVASIGIFIGPKLLILREIVWLSTCLLRGVYGKTYSEFS